jgi:hypothetical protein
MFPVTPTSFNEAGCRRLNERYPKRSPSGEAARSYRPLPFLFSTGKILMKTSTVGDLPVVDLERLTDRELLPPSFCAPETLRSKTIPMRSSAVIRRVCGTPRRSKIERLLCDARTAGIEGAAGVGHQSAVLHATGIRGERSVYGGEAFRTFDDPCLGVHG